MAILADLFVSTLPDASSYPPTGGGNSHARFQSVEFKGLTNLEFGTLWAIVDGEEFDFDKHALLSLSPEGETWLFQFPVAYVQKLASLTPTRIDEASAEWAGTEELQWNPSEAKEVIVELTRLAKLSSSSSKGLILWGSL